MQQVQINYAIADILFGIKQISRGWSAALSQPAVDLASCRFRNNLHESVCAPTAYLVRIETAFHLHDGEYKRRINAIARSKSMDDVMIA